MDGEMELLKDLQVTFIKESEISITDLMLITSKIKKDVYDGIEEILRITHTIKGNAQAVGFPSCGEYLHEFESVLEIGIETIGKLGSAFAESDKEVFEFFLSSIVDEIGYYLNDLKSETPDSEQLKNKRIPALKILREWLLTNSAGKSIPQKEAKNPNPSPRSEQGASKLESSSPTVSSSSEIVTSKKEIENFTSNLFLIFQNGLQYFAIPVECVTEVIKTQPLSAPPRKRSNLSGLLNLRGEVLPILNLHDILKNSEILPKYIVVSQIQDLRFGFQVEIVHQIVPLDLEQFQENPKLTSSTDRNLISHFCQFEEKTISILKISEAAEV